MTQRSTAPNAAIKSGMRLKTLSRPEMGAFTAPLVCFSLAQVPDSEIPTSRWEPAETQGPCPDLRGASSHYRKAPFFQRGLTCTGSPVVPPSHGPSRSLRLKEEIKQHLAAPDRPGRPRKNPKTDRDRSPECPESLESSRGKRIQTYPGAGGPPGGPPSAFSTVGKAPPL